ncbi:alpha/beta hydrolase [Actinoplanes missouriensis]|uniref:alpha/beta hydrolase n=1 Tax=Actinoplanes missouriensis TaxID=1866 RepID=UPI0033E06138
MKGSFEPSLLRSAVAGLAATALLALAACTSAAPKDGPAWVESAPGSSAADAGSARTTADEARQVDAVRADIAWTACGSAQCGTLEVPLDYDEPDGETIELTLTRIKAKSRADRRGTLFVNPGGPGVSSTSFARDAPAFFSRKILNRYDIVGVEPRGVGGRSVLRCFTSADDLQEAMKGSAAAFPYTPSEERAAVESATAVGTACSTTGKKLAAAMSTAEVARDMEVARRAVGDERLHYYGKSYGSVLGQVYANMFPDRVGAMVIDGVIDPRRWLGPRDTPDLDPAGAGDGAHRALTEILARCDKAGRSACAVAGDAQQTFDDLVDRLREAPVTVDEPGYGRISVGYADFIAKVNASLYAPSGPAEIVDMMRRYRTAATKSRAGGTTAMAPLGQGPVREPAFDYPGEGRYGVLCTDIRGFPGNAADVTALAAQADQRAPHFGRLWAWNFAACAGATWTAQDEDAYRGPFDRRTANPVLVVGNTWDPATNYSGARAAADLLPGSRLLSSDNWGHTAYAHSPCVRTAVDGYLLTGKLPVEGAVCEGNEQPFA